MFKLFGLIFFVLSANSYGVSCDCKLYAIPPLASSKQIPIKLLKTFEIEEYSSFSKKSQSLCRDSCIDEFESNLPSFKLNLLLIDYVEELVNKGSVGFLCTNLTPFKFPIKLKAFLGGYSLGNISDFIQVVHYDQKCF